MITILVFIVLGIICFKIGGFFHSLEDRLRLYQSSESKKRYEEGLLQKHKKSREEQEIKFKELSENKYISSEYRPPGGLGQEDVKLRLEIEKMTREG
jgi:replication fork clamp-binding protein CrfC